MPLPTAQTTRGFAGPLGGIYSVPGFYIPSGKPRIDALLDAVPHLIRHWRLDEYQFSGSTITVATDQVGTDNLTVNGAPGYEQHDGPTWGSMQLDAGVYLIGSVAINNDPMSIYLWFRPLSFPAAEALGVGGNIFSLGASGAVYGPTRQIKMGIHGDLIFNLDASTSIAGPRMEIGRFYEIIARTNSGTADLWVDGVQYGAGTSYSGAPGASLYPIVGNPDTGTIGSFTKASSGQFGAVAIYSTLYPTGTSLISEAAVDDANVRLTAADIEVLRTSSPHVLATHENMEVLRTGNFHLRVTQASMEVLRSTAGGSAFSVSATTNFTVSTTASEVVGHTFSVSATTNFTVSTTASETVGHTFLVSATTNFTVAESGAAFVHHPTNYPVSATTSFVVSDIAHVYDARHLFVSALTSLTFHSSAYFPVDRMLSATTGLYIYGLAHGYDSTRVLVSATTGIILEATAAKPIYFGPRPVSAATRFVVSSPAGVMANRLWLVSASTGMTLSVTASKNALLVVSASSTMIVSSAARQNRDIHAGASTGLGLASAPVTSNLKTAHATNTVIFVTSAGVVVTGTLARSDFVMIDLAQAVVWMPWRPAGLTRPPGGNLPHS